MTIHEMYGRLLEERLAEHEAHLKTLQLLGDLKLGKVKIDQVSISFNANDEPTWTVVPEPKQE